MLLPQEPLCKLNPSSHFLFATQMGFSFLDGSLSNAPKPRMRSASALKTSIKANTTQDACHPCGNHRAGKAGCVQARLCAEANQQAKQCRRHQTRTNSKSHFNTSVPCHVRQAGHPLTAESEAKPESLRDGGSAPPQPRAVPHTGRSSLEGPELERRREGTGLAQGLPGFNPQHSCSLLCPVSNDI